MEPPGNPQNVVRVKLARPVAFCPHLSMGLALSQVRHDFVRLPSGISLGEAKVGHFETGPLHNNLEKRWSELSWVDCVNRYAESGGPRSQGDSFGIPERQRILTLNFRTADLCNTTHV
jgi:hypothetical protein